ncbi:hypothetical protein [uncultured Sphingosinicella sp.]|uniref:hypothetical protein n=1 Tax=uncultured Sphingosinicella sp. TaxID=478748 RepID=UPI0030DCD86A|tara:strand:- start:745 stop:921 length:177 start_codon:yes stop_codon:yes gene_type:complete
MIFHFRFGKFILKIISRKALMNDQAALRRHAAMHLAGLSDAASDRARGVFWEAKAKQP